VHLVSYQEEEGIYYSSVEDREPASCSENIYLILTLRQQELDGVTIFPYFLHREIGGFTASKLLD
jgi:hypothetical protein